MRALELTDVKDIAAYEKVRDEFRRRIIELKKLRRIGVGDIITLVFENRDTLLFQVQEMMRAERIVHDHQIQEELDTYNPLLPGQLELSATLFIEIDNPQELRRRLSTLLGIEEHLALVIGENRVPARFEEGRSTAERLSTVHYVRFQLTLPQVAQLKDPIVEVALEFDHPNYRERAVIPIPMRLELAKDPE
ncbi:MAG: DUF3501 family protein [Chloroflexi bacterium]|uniref:DUF3501 family protein n=1 Tax=Candidatus Chlorohelix allophototropha TaxID=3003348 RepID=A0A8T7LZU3_9CHLR|nr:DUF3501 family protein [Chloroflexota bacterium]WJW66422.1 DUF3501 family protein [Chloroflexota bacterium L227-S17]